MPENPKETLESFVTSALRSRLQESARSVIELRQQMNAALEKVESSIQIAGEKTVSIPEDLLPSPAPPPGGEEAILGHIYKAQQEMLTATEQVGLLTQLLLSCTVSCPRVAFFIVRKDVLMGWAARGFESARDADVRSLSIAFDEESIIGAAYRSGAPVIATPGEHPGDEAILSKLGGGQPAESIAVPIFLRDKVAAVLYGDCGREPAIVDPEVPQILALHAGLCLETLATRQKFPRPRTGMVSSRAGAPAASPAPAGRASQAGRAAPSPAAAAPSSYGADPASLSSVFRKPEGLTPPGGIPLTR
jgi:hypothetical protein